MQLFGPFINRPGGAARSGRRGGRFVVGGGGGGGSFMLQWCPTSWCSNATRTCALMGRGVDLACVSLSARIAAGERVRATVLSCSWPCGPSNGGGDGGGMASETTGTGPRGVGVGSSCRPIVVNDPAIKRLPTVLNDPVTQNAPQEHEPQEDEPHVCGPSCRHECMSAPKLRGESVRSNGVGPIGSLGTYTCVYMCPHVSTHVYTHVYTSVNTYFCTHVYTSVNTYFCTHAYTSVNTYFCTHVYKRVHAHVRTRACTCP